MLHVYNFFHIVFVLQPINSIFSPNGTCGIVEPVDFRTGKKQTNSLALLAARLLARRISCLGYFRFRALLSFDLFLSFSLTWGLLRDLRFLTAAGVIDNFEILGPDSSFSNPQLWMCSRENFVGCYTSSTCRTSPGPPREK